MFTCVGIYGDGGWGEGDDVIIDASLGYRLEGGDPEGLVFAFGMLDFFSSPKKGKEDLVTLIWENRKMLRKIKYE